LGVNENWVRHVGQNPSVRPGRSLRDRPTGWAQYEQYRLSSGTSATAMIASAGSPVGTAGTSTNPSPSRVPPLRRDTGPESPPRRARASAEPRRVTTEAGRSRGSAGRPPLVPGAPVVVPGAAEPAAPPMPVPDGPPTAAARPQVSQ
jgi:hypothetical protein